MWSLGALLFGHLTRNCRCSHCPGINSNYALYSDGFCASDPRPLPPPPAPPSPLRSPLLAHTHTHSPNTHFPLFSATTLPPLPSCAAFPPTPLLVNSFGYWSTPVPLWMNLEKYAHSKGKGKDEEEEMHNTRGISEAIPELNQFYISVGFFPSIKNAVRFQYG